MGNRGGAPNPILGLGAVELRDRLARGAVRAVEIAEASLAQIAATEPRVQAWAWLDGAHVLDQARSLDAHRSAGRPIGPLHGVPVALKDIIDTAGMPTANGTALDAGRVPTADAFVVERLKAAGAIIMGKTVTTELAFMHPGKTRNPHNPDHTPGGSSSGSAAAVAAGMVPLAIGTQTGGSVIRPASYCGVTGFKPSFGAIPRTGILTQSPSLDTVGVFARSPEDAALLAESLFGYSADDRATQPIPAPRLLETALSAPPVTPTLA
ncbi:MAG: amidase, partial [Rhodospirillaceae bacterium]|nr:amidase [Rhodospirillaceae bacterium]